MSSRSTRFRIAVAGLAALLAVGWGPLSGGSAQAQVDTGEFCANAPDSDPFTDVADDDQNVANIRCLVASEITVGVTPTTYEPANPVTRRQMALFIKRLIDTANELETADLAALPADDGASTFPDIADESPEFQGAIRQLEDAEIIDGKDDGTYGPADLVSRDQMAKFIANALEFLLGAPLPDGPDAFTDDTGVFEVFINRLARAEIVVGITANTYGPRLDVTRRQMASFLIRGLAVLHQLNAITELNPEDDENVPVTTRPELVSAEILGTTTAGEVTPTNPLGTSVQFNFDEDVDGVPADETDFKIYDANGVVVAIGTDIVSQTDPAVVVLFATVATDEAAETLTLATVDLGAVTDNDGQVNPEGDAAIGEESTDTGGDAGVTESPDLVSVGGFRQGAVVGTTAVDFTFDEAAFQDATPTPSATDIMGYLLMLPNGDEVACTGPAALTNTPSGGTSAGGNGTTVHTVVCPNEGITVPNPNGTLFSATNVARGVLDYGSHTVEDADTPAIGNVNVLGAADVSNSGNTANPDLVSAEFQPGATPADDDQVLFVFDEDVVTPVPAEFYVYEPNTGVPGMGSTPLGQGTPGTAATVNPVEGTEVLVDFPPGTLADAVGVTIDDGAVLADDNGAPNQEDEVGVANATSTTQTPGETAAPQLVTVALDQPDDGFGNPGDFEANYGFDADVLLLSVGDHYLYLADGTRLQATACTDGSATATPDDDDTVNCTAFDIVSPPGTLGPADSDTTGDAVLGTVDDGAVIEDGGPLTNPEGAEPTTGGTGTPTP